MATGTIQKQGWALLWANQDTSSSFAAQSVEIDLSNYTEISIHFRHTTSSDSYEDVQGFVGSHLFMRLFGYVSTASGAVDVFAREAIATTSGVEFKGAFEKRVNNTGAGSAYNAACIPDKIYARK